MKKLLAFLLFVPCLAYGQSANRLLLSQRNGAGTNNSQVNIAAQSNMGTGDQTLATFLSAIGLGTEDSPTFTGATLSGLTAGRVPFAGVGGALTDAASLTFNSGTGALSATTFVGALTGNVTGNVSGSAGSATGNAGTATALQNARTIGGSSFDGTGNVTSFPSPGAIGGGTPSTGAFTTVDTGQGANELFDMDQNVQTTDSPQFAGVNVGAATDTTITRTGAGDIAVEGNGIYRAGGTDVAVADGGTGQGSYTDGQLLIGNSSGNTLTKATLTAGSNVTITNGNGSITIAASGGGGASDTIISPSQLTADTDDWNPTGLSTATIIRVDSDSTLRYLSSITAPGGGAIQRVRLINVGSNTLILKDQASGLGTAANRLALGGYDLPLFPAGSIDLVYDTTSTRWRALDPQSHVIPPRRFGAYLANLSFPIGPSSNTSTYAHNIASATSGTGASAAVVTSESTNILSYVQQATGTDTTGRASHAGGGGQFLLGNGWYWRFSARARIVALSDGTDTYTYRLGFGDNVAGETTDGVFIRYTHGTNSGRFELVLRSNNSESVATEVGGGAAPVANTWFNLDIVVTPTRAEAYKDGVLFASTTTMTNLPTGSGRTTGVLAVIIKSAGTTSRAAHLAFLETVGYPVTP